MVVTPKAGQSLPFPPHTLVTDLGKEKGHQSLKFTARLADSSLCTRFAGTRTEGSRRRERGKSTMDGRACKKCSTFSSLVLRRAASNSIPVESDIALRKKESPSISGQDPFMCPNTQYTMGADRPSVSDRTNDQSWTEVFSSDFGIILVPSREEMTVGDEVHE